MEEGLTAIFARETSAFVDYDVVESYDTLSFAEITSGMRFQTSFR